MAGYYQSIAGHRHCMWTRMARSAWTLWPTPIAASVTCPTALMTLPTTTPIYDPAHGRWRYSARGEGNGYGEMAVLRDGRVVRSLSLPPPADQPDGEYRQLLGLSSADGRSWDNLALQGPMPELWSQGGELFGLRGDDEGAQELLWLDLETRSWVRLPHWKRDDRAQEASFVLFQTSLADGRRLWLPDRMPR